jgi:hypothetical protein
MPAPPAAGQSSAFPEAAATIVHTAALGTYDYWDGRTGSLEDSDWGYGATAKYLTGSAGGTRLGLGLTWVRNNLDTGSSDLVAGNHRFQGELTVERTAVDFLYGLPENRNGNVPYFLGGVGRQSGRGGTTDGGSATVRERFWELGMGIINGQAQALAFALEAKYAGAWENWEIGGDRGMVELSMSVGYNW